MKHYHPCFDELIAHLLTFLPDIDKRFPDLLIPLLPEPFTTKEDLIILKPGQVAGFAYWPVTGFSRSFKLVKPEEDRVYAEEKTISVSFPGKIDLCPDSFMNRNAVDFFVEMARGSTMVAFSHTAFQTISKEIPEVAILATNIISDANEDWKKRVEICKVKGLAGYKTFLETFKDVESFIPLKHIASCIGVSAEHLSRIRREGGFADDNLRR